MAYYNLTFTCSLAAMKIGGAYFYPILAAISAIWAGVHWERGLPDLFVISKDFPSLINFLTLIMKALEHLQAGRHDVLHRLGRTDHSCAEFSLGRIHDENWRGTEKAQYL